MSFVEPTFEIDEKGRVICRSHSHYPFFMMPDKSFFQDQQMEKVLTCKTCVHYKQDDCFFPKKEIDKIEYDRVEGNKYSCQLCGNTIDRMLSVIQKLYLKERFKVEIPLICCICYETLKNKTFLDFFNKRIYISLFLDLVIILIFFSQPTPFNFIYAAFYFTFIIFIKYLFKKAFHLNLFLKDLIKGKKYYEKYFRKKN